MDIGRDLKIFFVRLHKDAVVPKYSFEWDACCDISSVESIVLKPMERYAISTGLAVQTPPGFEMQIRPRSGLAFKQGLTVLNTPGTIDAGYRGEVKPLLVNLGEESIKINKGDRIAQLKFSPVYIGHFIEVDNLNATSRGTGGFGHTGV